MSYKKTDTDQSYRHPRMFLSGIQPFKDIGFPIKTFGNNRDYFITLNDKW